MNVLIHYKEYDDGTVKKKETIFDKEYVKVKNYTYTEYCDYLKEKYGLAKKSYFTENFKKKNVQIFKGYTECCCKACAVKNPVRCKKKKISETHLRRSKEDPEYWNRRYEKSKRTNIAKYGVENVS